MTRLHRILVTASVVLVIGCATTRAKAEPTETSPAPKPAGEPLICLWQHEQEVDIAPVVKELGFNVVWTDDDPYDGTQSWEDTHMYRALQVPGVKYVIPKVDRAAWGWTQEIALRHAKWVAQLSLEHEQIIGLYLNDFYDEIEDGHRTMEQWRQIIAAVRSVNPKLNLWVPSYPHRRNENQPYDFDYQGVILNIWDPRGLGTADEHLTTAEAQHAGKLILGGVYINSGSRRARWLTEEQFKNALKLYVSHINAGKLNGLRVYCASQFVERPEYVTWAKEIMKDLAPPG